MRGLVLSLLLLLVALAGCTADPEPEPTVEETGARLADLTECEVLDGAGTRVACETNVDVVQAHPLPSGGTWMCYDGTSGDNFGFALYYHLTSQQVGIGYRFGLEADLFPGWFHVTADGFDARFATTGDRGEGFVVIPGLTANLQDVVNLEGHMLDVSYSSNRTELANASKSFAWILPTDVAAAEAIQIHMFQSGNQTYYLPMGGVTNYNLNGIDFRLSVAESSWDFGGESVIHPLNMSQDCPL